MHRGKRTSEAPSPSWKFARQPCKDYLKCTCTRSLCDPLQCQFHKTESGCKAGDKCLFPRRKVDEQPNKKLQKSYFSTNCTTIGLCRKTQNHWNLRETQSLGKTRCKKFWDQFDEYDSHSLRHVKQVSGKIRDHRFEKYKSKFLVSAVPTL